MSSRRTSLPGAAELFRTTTVPTEAVEHEPNHATVGATVARTAPADERDELEMPVRRAPMAVVPSSNQPAPPRPTTPSRPTAVRTTRRIRPEADRNPSGRERHDEKITVYCSPEELLDLESARLHLRAEHGLAVDRGRIVREALAVVLADLEAKGESSILVRRLREA
jgi:hypothetical protein